MLNTHYRAKNTRRSGRKRTSGLRYETTAQAVRLNVYGRRRTPSLGGLFVRSKSRQRRSQVRLGDQRATAQVRPAATTHKGVRISLRLVINVAVLALMCWLLAWFFLADRFYINQVLVEGNQRVSAEAIAAASGIQGYSIFWVNTRQIALAVAETLPPIQQVSVQYRLPNTVRLAVQEHGEEVMWSIGEQRYWVDEEGKFHLAQAGNEPQLVVQDIRPGLPAEVEVDALLAARQIARLLPEVKTVEYAPLTGLRLVHPRGWLVYLGTGSDMVRKVNVLRAIERQLAPDAPQPSLIDLRFPDTPYYRFPDEGEGG